MSPSAVARFGFHSGSGATRTASSWRRTAVSRRCQASHASPKCAASERGLATTTRPSRRRILHLLGGWAMTAANAPATSAAVWRQMLPREHVAWGLLPQPFLAGALAGPLPAGLWAPSLLLLLVGFLIRSPLLDLVRSWFPSGGAAPGLRVAWIWILCEVSIIAVCLWVLWPRLHRPEALRDPLTQVGRRTLALSVLHLSVCLYSVWPLRM